MYSKVNYTIVGLFVLIFSAGLMWFAFWLAKYGLEEDFLTYRLEMKESIAGLSKDSNVKLHGVNVGRVDLIRINPENIEVIEILLNIKKDIPIKEDMTASTQMLGVTGLLSIEIDGGSNGAKTLRATDEYIPLIKTKASLVSKLTQSLSGISDNLEVLLQQSEKLLSDHNIETVGNIFDNVEKITAKGEEVEQKAIVSLEEIDTTLKKFRVSIDNINTRFTQATKDFEKMQKDFSGIKKVTIPTIENIMQISQNFNRMILKIEQSLDRGDYNLKKMFEPMLVEIQILSNQLGDISKQFGNNPSDILFKSRKTRRGPGE